MNHEEKIRELEEQLQAEETKTKDLFRAGKIPARADYADLDRIKSELKAARRVRAMDAKRVDPKLTRRIGLLLPEDEYQALTKKAAEAGVDLSKYIRNILKS
jgi:predicted DNA binding CopG/RHH family protein